MMYISDHKRILINEVLKLGLTKPFHKIELNDHNEYLAMKIYDNIPVRSTGLYAIYALTEDRVTNECLYVGESAWCVNQRIRRFFKELSGYNHPDEEHAAARKAKEADYQLYSHEYKVKYIPWDEIYDIADRLSLYTDFNDLDEYIAHHLKSKYNSSTYLKYGYNGNTLKHFLEAA